MSEAPTKTPPSAWLLRVASVEAAPLFSHFLAISPSLLRGIQTGDAICVASSDGNQVIGIARVFRTRAESGGTRIYFDGQSSISPGRSLTEFGIELPVDRFPHSAVIRPTSKHTSASCFKSQPLTTCLDQLADPMKKSSA